MEESKSYAISSKLLLLVYGIVPIVLTLILVDTFFFDHVIRATFGLSLVSAAVYILFLELPHIIGSFISFADKEYVQFYKWKIFVGLPILLSVTALLLYYFPVPTFALYLVYTMYHSIKQQTGIAGILVGEKSTLHSWWTYSAIGCAIIGNFFIFAPNLSKYLPGIITLPFFTYAVLIFLGISCLYLMRLPPRNTGWAYIGATTLLLGVGYISIAMGYFFFAVFLIRFVHDVTAFIFYAVHDSNRNSKSSKNIFYIIPRKLRVPIIIVTPVCAIVVAHLIQTYAISPSHSAALLVLLGCAHYYIESFMWKRDSLHRAQLKFTF